MYQSKLDVAELRLKRSEERVSQSEEIINRQNKLVRKAKFLNKMFYSLLIVALLIHVVEPAW